MGTMNLHFLTIFVKLAFLICHIDDNHDKDNENEVFPQTLNQWE